MIITFDVDLEKFRYSLVGDGELNKHLADKALNKIQEKYPERHIYMIDYKYFGNTIEIIR